MIIMNKNSLSSINNSYESFNNNNNHDEDDEDDDDNYGVDGNCVKRRKLSDNERILRWYVNKLLSYIYVYMI